jgi:hypothetical protein
LAAGQECDHDTTDPLVQNSVPTKPKSGGSSSPNPMGTSPAAPDPKGKASPHLTPGAWVLSRPTPWERNHPTRPGGPRGRPRAWAPAGPPPAPNCHEHGWWAPDHAPNTRRGWGHLNLTSGYHQLYLDTHVSNSAEWTSTVRLDSHVTLDRLAISYDRDRSGGAVERWCLFVAPVMDEEIMTKTVTLTCGAGGRHNHSTRASIVICRTHPWGKGWRSSGAAPSIVPLCLLLSLTLVS